jgi:hypothetical protein
VYSSGYVMKYLVFNIGCIECGVSSNVVGVFATKEQADRYAEKLTEMREYSWRQGGQNSYEVFELKDEFYVNDEYTKFIPEDLTPEEYMSGVSSRKRE